MSTAAATASASLLSPRVLHGAGARQVTLIEVLDRLLQAGVVIQGQVMLAAADIDLVEVDLRILVTAVNRLANQ